MESYFTDQSEEKTVPQGPGLPSFTEVNFSDLTSMTSAVGSPSESSRGIEARQVDEANDIKKEIENILLQLDQIFLSAESQSK